MLYGMADLTRSFVGIGQRGERLRDGEFWALDNVSFELKRGECLGLIGLNGSGKSTLLKLLNGIFMPDRGRIEINGRMGALIEVGAGFHPMLTGRENIYVNGAILGMTKKEIDKKFDEIVDFAGIGEFIDSPVKHYSSGMYVRLGFSVAVHCEPDILLVDEVLSVGDMDFQYKCFKKIDEFKRNGKSLALVSHDIMIINKLCGKVIFLDQGTVKYDSNTGDAIDQYLADTTEKEVKRVSKKFGHINEIDKKKSKKIFFSNVRLCDSEGKETNVFNVGQPIIVKATLDADIKVDTPVFGGIIYSEDGIYLGGFNSLSAADSIMRSLEGSYEIEYHIGGLFLSGVYHLSLVIHDATGKIIYDVHDKSFSFVIKGNAMSLPYTGYVRVPCEWKYKKLSVNEVKYGFAD
ncbi:MAG: ABC transporter ATP-binding protein [Deltaproteobacteria bacterium]|nr:ABC transporter ATP-binding protein [Deltaproteobacteria bacterium]